MIIQIYEIQNPKEADALVKLGVDHIGSVIVSDRDWKIPEIKETVQHVGTTASKSSLIPLFNDYETVCRTLDYYSPDIVHFCELFKGNRNGSGSTVESLVVFQEKIKKAFPEIQIMRSIPITRSGSVHKVPTLDYAEAFEPVSDLFLTDTLILSDNEASEKDQPVQGFVGITGKTCDWAMARELVASVRIPVILAGGISPNNAYEGAFQVKPFGVDSCTGTNAVDGAGQTIRFKKDLGKVKQLVEAVRLAEKWLQTGQNE